MEHVRQLPVRRRGDDNRPVHSADTLNPDYRVNGTSFGLNRDGTNPKPLVYNGRTLPGASSAISGGVMNAGPINWRAATCMADLPLRHRAAGARANCANCKLGDLRRVIIAITGRHDGVGGRAALSGASVRRDQPRRRLRGAPCPPPAAGATRRSPPSGSPTRRCNNTDHVAVPGTHLTHNTRGACSDGMRTGTTKGAPDLLNDDPALGSDAAAGTEHALRLRQRRQPARARRRPTSGSRCAAQSRPTAAALAQQAGTTLDFPSSEANVSRPSLAPEGAPLGQQPAERQLPDPEQLRRQRSSWRRRPSTAPRTPAASASTCSSGSRSTGRADRRRPATNSEASPRDLVHLHPQPVADAVDRDRDSAEARLVVETRSRLQHRRPAATRDRGPGRACGHRRRRPRVHVRPSELRQPDRGPDSARDDDSALSERVPAAQPSRRDRR